MYLRILVSAAILTAVGCSSGPKGPFTEADFNANRESYVKSYTDVSSGGVLDESKKVIIPDFKVYFQTEARCAA